MMAQTIAARPTVYEGVTFRSRLEARWAVFWNALGLPWIYEPEVPVDGLQYQPDFLLGRLWIEVKPESWEPSDADLRKYALLVTATEKDMFVMFGSPGKWTNGQLDDRQVKALRVQVEYGIASFERYELVECPKCGAVQFCPLGGHPNCPCWQRTPQIDNAMRLVRLERYEDA